MFNASQRSSLFCVKATVTLSNSLIALELHRVPLSLCLGVGHTDIAHRIRHIKRGTSELKETPIVSCYAFVFSFVPGPLYFFHAHA